MHAARSKLGTHCRRVSLWLIASFAIAMLAACLELVSDKDLQDCDAREKRARDPDLSSCARASEYMEGEAAEGCVPAAAFEAEQDCLVLDVSAILCDDGMPFDMEVYLAESDVVLDCNGQTIEHAEDRRARSGIRTPYQRSVADVLVERCTIRYVQGYGVDLKRFFRGSELEGPMQGHERIAIVDSHIAHVDRIGIYVGQNSRDVTIDSVVISDAYAGIYLEAGSKGSLVTRVKVLDSYERAGIHVDSSQENLIEHSRFEGNAGGSIRLYKNCGERYGQVCPIRRQLDASHNTIRYNQFYGEGVSIAARQFKTYTMGWCAGIDVLGHWRDHSDDNAVYGNRFYHGSTLSIQDEPNLVFSNHFLDSVLEIGTSAPIGDGAIYFSGSITGNSFGDESWIGVIGKPDQALHDVEVAGNTDASGNCYSEYRLRVPCAGTSGGKCYGTPRRMEQSVCGLPQ